VGGHNLRPPRPNREERMSIRARIDRLEGKRDAEHCPECRLRPKATYAVYPGEDDHTLPEPEHCPTCGRLIERLVLKVVYEDLEGEGEPY
jgi:hypothetical protein